MYCPSCKAVVDDSDRFCPKCGAGVTIETRAREATGAPRAPLTIAACADEGARTAAGRAGLAEGGAKYPGLTRAAAFAIRLASLTRILAYVLAPLGAASVIVVLYGKTRDLWSVAIGLAAGLVMLFVSQVGALLLSVLGEMMYVVIDVEDGIRRRQ